MKKINILSKSIYNRIAAGEVVERPYSAVKELIENSVDAGATSIEIYIERGGKQLIKVADNGSGIYKDDLAAAFLPHATSKISTVDDLDNITTLGFRGEALASISSISQTEIVSVTAGNPAYKISCEGGVVGEVLPAALQQGTVVTVRNLFYNTPVRAKFLKPDKKEETDISSFVSRYLLLKPDISFKYYVDGKLSLQSFGGGLDEAMAQVYGAKILPQCIKIDAVHEGIHIYGFIGNQNFFKPNKSYQSLFLNGRYIVNATIATAISNAYAAYAMKRQFPFYVLNVDVPAEMVDVNVHPNKADVRFVDSRVVFGAVYKVISGVLDGTATAAQFVADGGRVPEMRSNIGENGNKNSVYSAPEVKVPPQISPELLQKYKPEPYFGSPEDIRIKKTEDDDEDEEEKYDPANDPNLTEEERMALTHFNPERDMSLFEYFGGPDELKKMEVPTELDGKFKGLNDNTLGLLPPELERARRIEVELEKHAQQYMEYSTCKYVGVVFNTYLIYEYHCAVYIIDQHAAHERLIFDKLMAKIKKRKIVAQPMLYPYILDVNKEEKLFVEKNLQALKDMGFGIEPFGIDTFRIDEVPSDLKDLNLKEFFAEVLSDLSGYKEIKLEDILKEKIATAACKHAVKGGMQLTEKEINKLFKMLNGDLGLKCPHGRPICVTMSKHDFEKLFKRVV